MPEKPDKQSNPQHEPPATESPQQAASAGQQDAPETETMRETYDKSNASFQEKKEHFYDKMNLSYRQIDIIVKVLIGLVLVLLVYGYLTGGSSPLK